MRHSVPSFGQLMADRHCDGFAVQSNVVVLEIVIAMRLESINNNKRLLKLFILAFGG